MLRITNAVTKLYPGTRFGIMAVNAINTVPYVYLALAMIIAGSAVVVGKLMVQSLPVFLAAELGIFVGLLFLLPLTFLKRRERMRHDLRTNLILLAQAVCGIVLYRVFIFWGLQYTTAAAGGLISSAAPVIIALLAFFMLKEALNGRRMAGVICVAAGLLSVNLQPFLTHSPQGADALKGNLLVFAAVLCEAAFSVMSKLQCAKMSALYRTTLVSLYAFLCLLPFALYDAGHYDIMTIDAASVLCIVYYGFFVSFLSYVFWFKGIATVAAGTAASFTGFVPLSSIFLAWGVLREPVSAVHFAGLACILAGIFLSCRSESLHGN